jgi:hypothetical protein
MNAFLSPTGSDAAVGLPQRPRGGTTVALHLTSGMRLQNVNLLYLIGGLGLRLGPFVVLNLWTK